MFENMPNYYRKSQVMTELLSSIEKEVNRLNDEVTLTENQFFVLLSDKDIERHEQDVGIPLDMSADIDTRRSRVLSKLRGTGTVTKTMLKNVAASFVNGDIEVVEYPSRYCFAVRFTSKEGVPFNIEDIKAMIEEIKPAHLAVEYVFTYRLWEDIRDVLQKWKMLTNYTWDWLLTFAEPKYVYLDAQNNIYFAPNNDGNATIVWDEKRAYARRNE
ncbi:MAG: DUF2313 domain-containing protein [Clostridia bacterium]|nr:DUF2313 domain-containing protein [Clostridia bacterium]